VSRELPEERNILSVTELNLQVRQLVEGTFPLGVWVGAEMRNIKFHSSGHLYFSLTDEESTVDGVMWRNVAQNIGFKPEDGMKVEAFGAPTLWEKTGRYQFSVRKLFPVGEGARAIAFRQLKEKLFTEGLFDPEHKKPLPKFPFTIGVVTSATGAALRDIVNVIGRRAPYVTVTIRPAKVQGEGSAEDIAGAIEDFNRYGNVDLLIVGRGGGSEDDLWCFNDEALARTIFASEIPIISAVGHEIDFTIADFVADLRAPTPSAAAEIAVRDIEELTAALRGYVITARNRCASLADNADARLRSVMSRPAWTEPLRKIREHEQRIDDWMAKADMIEASLFERSAGRAQRLAEKLAGLNIKNTLKRGFAIVYRDGKAIESAANLTTEDAVDIEFKDGNKSAVIK